MTSGVTIRLVTSVMSAVKTCTGRSWSVNSRRRLTSSVVPIRQLSSRTVGDYQLKIVWVDGWFSLYSRSKVCWASVASLELFGMVNARRRRCGRSHPRCVLVYDDGDVQDVIWLRAKRDYVDGPGSYSLCFTSCSPRISICRLVGLHALPFFDDPKLDVA
jgi:hypothetical protein